MREALKAAVGRSLQGRAGSRLVLAPTVSAGYRIFRRTGRTPPISYSAMRKLFGSAAWERFEALADQSALVHGPLDLGPPAGVAAGEVDEAIDALNRDGVAVLGRRLPAPVLDSLRALAERSICSLTDRRSGAPATALFDVAAPVAVRYDLAEADLLADQAVQALLADRSLLHVAQGYLGCAPVQDLVAMWWSAADDGAASSAAAQRFHFDLDRLRFVKLFAYLTDVDEETGPHHFVRGSHRHLPDPLRRDRRFDDDEVLRHYGPGDIVSVAGEAGTLFLADTRGFHRGAPLRRGNRLVFQLEWASSLFGQPVARQELRVRSPELADAVVALPAVYERFDVVGP